MVNIPLILDPEVMFLTQYPYTLREVIYHSGLFSKGHYIGYVRYAVSQNWALCDDNAVCVLKDPKAIKKPYVIVHSRL